MEIDYVLFAVDSTLESAGIPFSTLPGTLKLSVTLSNWNFSSPSDTLHIHFSLNIQPSVTNIGQSSSGNITTFLLISDLLNTTIDLLHLGIADNSSIVPIQFFLNSSSPLGSGGNNSTLDLELVIPSFASSFHYDPDFSVTFLGENGASGSGDGGSGGNLLPLLALIALVIPVGMVVIVVAVVLVVVLLKRRKYRQSMQGDAVNWS